MRARAFTLRSAETNTEYAIQIAHSEDAQPVPAVLFMDGDDQFEAAVEAYRRSLARGDVEPLLLVGVGYGGGYNSPLNRRVRDYTPTAMPTEKDSGGADAFLGFLCSTLWRELGERYAIREDLRGIAGHSLGSLLAIHAVLEPRPFFNRFLASAPALWWDDRAILCAADRRQRTGAACPGRLYLCCGTEDTVSMLSDLEQFERQLDAAPFPDLEVISERLPGRDHYNGLVDAFRGGLCALFRGSEA